MDPAQYRRLSELFAAVRSLNADARQAFLDRVGGESASLRAELEAFLIADEEGDSEGPLRTVAEPQSSTPSAAAEPEEGGIGQRVGRYEILEEIGRGGIGVVYKARQVDLDRTVALKMLLVGAYAGPADLARFQREAAALASLQDPHFVQIYEVGEDGGVPYFSFEFVDGGTLADKIKGLPQPALQAAELVETLARALQAAHERGIIHRDLKPANVLLTKTGVPKITDFGLVKRLDAAAQQTQSGAIIGTPSYMAPEQASGKNREIGPAADVYALGAILYEMLTARPPFLAETPLDTMLQVMSGDPVPPCRLLPKIPRDLETICLKALAKEPSRRYTSALALAQDLERFRAGEPILARPEGITRKVHRKLHRHRVAAAVTVALLAIAVAAWGGFEYRHVQQIERITEQINAALEAGVCTKDQVASVDDLIADLAWLAPEKAADYREKVNKALDRFLDEQLRKPSRLLPNDRSRIDEALDLLAARAPDWAAPLRHLRDSRYTSWETVIDLQPSFTGWQKIFRGGSVLSDRTALVSNPPGSAPGIHRIFTDQPCRGDVEIEAEFDRSWESAVELGFRLAHGKDATRRETFYDFLLAVPAPSTGDRREASPPHPGNFATALQAGQPLRLQILRDQKPQRQDHRRIAPGPLTLTARRRGDELTFQVNDAGLVVFRDLLLAGDKTWTFDLTWPKGVRLLRLYVQRASPPTGSSLEQGDDLYAKGLYRAALDYYLKQNLTAGATKEGQQVRRQALCMAGFCRLRLNQLADARRHFEQVAFDVTSDSGEPWALMARYQLWLLLVRDQRFDETEGLFLRIKADDPDFKESASLIPDELRKQIAYAYFNTIGDLADPKIVHRRELCVDVCDYLQAASDRAPARIALLRAYWWFGQDDLAFKTAVQTRKLCEPYSETPGNLLAEMLRHYSWLLRRRGEAGRALEEVQQGLNRPGGLYHSLTALAAGSVGGSGAPPGQRPLLAASALVAGMAACRSGWFSADLTLLVERCRVHAALSRWDKAEADLEEFFRLGPTDLVPYRVFCQACLMQGFLREHLGDHPGAVRAWRRGLFPNWAPHRDAETRQHQFADLTERFHHLMLASLNNELGDADVQLLWGKDVPGHFVAYLKQFMPTSVFRDMCRTPRGRDAARRYAFLELSLPEHGRLPISILLAEFFHQGAVPGELSREQEELLWQTAERCVLDATTKKLGLVQQLQLLCAFQGRNDLLLGWPAVSGSLEPSLRGPLAYVLSQRYLRVLKKPAQEAVALFRTAWKDAPADSPLRRLAQAELDRLQRK
jgi:hypothetical protein